MSEQKGPSVTGREYAEGDTVESWIKRMEVEIRSLEAQRKSMARNLLEMREAHEKMEVKFKALLTSTDRQIYEAQTTLQVEIDSLKYTLTSKDRDLFMMEVEVDSLLTENEHLRTALEETGKKAEKNALVMEVDVFL